MADDKIITVRMDPTLHAALADRAVEEDRSVSALIRVACRAYLAVIEGAGKP